MIKTQELKKFKNILYSYKTFFLTFHTAPDADSVGSCLSLYEFLKKNNKKADVYSYDHINENLMILPYSTHIKNNINQFNYDVGIFFECSEPHRCGFDISRLRFKKTVNIDHHKTAKRYADLNIIYPTIPSTSQIMWHIFEYFNFKLTKTMAINIYSGIITDTGRFQYPQTLPETFYIAGKLIQYGFDFNEINNNFFNRTTYKNLKLLGIALTSMVIENGIAYMIIRKDDFNKYNADFTDTENIINYPLMLPEVKVVFLIKEDEDKYNVTFRSKGNIDVSKIASVFNGGGHKNASGFKISKEKIGDIDSLKSKVILCIQREMKKDTKKSQASF